jgi:hypothetical protein
MLGLRAAPVSAEGALRRAVYDVPHGCAPRSVWLGQLRAQLQPRLRSELEALPVHVELERALGSERAYSGWLGGADADVPGTRVHGRSCDEVLEALALVATLSLEHGAAPEPSPAVETLDSFGAPIDATDPVAEATSAASVDAAVQVGGPRLGAVGFTLLQTSIAPALSLDFGLGVTLDWSAAAWQPWLSLGAYVSSRSQTRAVEQATARFQHWGVRAIGCPWRFPRSGAFGLRPCLGTDVGRSSGKGEGVPNATGRSWPWWSAFAELRLDTELLPGLQLAVSGGPVVGLVRPRYYFVPGIEAFAAAPWGFAGSGSLGVVF